MRFTGIKVEDGLTDYQALEFPDGYWWGHDGQYWNCTRRESELIKQLVTAKKELEQKTFTVNWLLESIRHRDSAITKVCQEFEAERIRQSEFLSSVRPCSQEEAEPEKDPIVEAIEEQWGERCPDYEESCILCQVWKQYDKLKGNSDERV
jgi:hypothetical protein